MKMGFRYYEMVRLSGCYIIIYWFRNIENKIFKRSMFTELEDIGDLRLSDLWVVGVSWCGGVWVGE